MLTSKDEIKIFILYLMRKIDFSTDYATIHDMCVQDGYVGSFDFIECFDDLVKNGNVVEETNESGEKVFKITETGICIADNLNGVLLDSVKEKSVKNALRMISFQKRGTKVTHSAESLPHGKYLFHCSIKEKETDLLDLSLTLDNKRQLDKIRYHFDVNPEFIYKGILALLSGEANYLIDD